MIYAKLFFYYSKRYKTDEKTTHNTGEELSEKEFENHIDNKIIRFGFSKPIRNKFKTLVCRFYKCLYGGYCMQYIADEKRYTSMQHRKTYVVFCSV